MRIAVIGTGPTGRLAALELAEAGHHVILHPGEPALRPALGQIHLGFAGPAGVERRALQAASALPGLLARWLGRDALDRLGAVGWFLYALPQGGPSPDALRARFAAVARTASDLSLPAEMRGWRELTGPERARLFDPAHVAAAFATRESALDPDALDHALADLTAAAPRIDFHPDPATAITAAPRGLRVATPGRPGDLHAAVLHVRPLATGTPWQVLQTQAPLACTGLPALRLMDHGGTVAFAATARLAAPPGGLDRLRDALPGAAQALDVPWETLPAPAAPDRPEGGRLRVRGGYLTVEEGALSLAPWAAHRACQRILGHPTQGSGA